VNNLASWAQFALPMSAMFSLFLTVSYLRSKWMLKAWALEKQHKIVESKWCWFIRGPFQDTWVTRQTVFRVRVLDSSGTERSCWAKLGGVYWGLWVDDVWIVWDDVPPQHTYPQFSVPLVLASVMLLFLLVAFLSRWR